MLRFATFLALCLTLIVASDGYAQRRGRGRYYAPAPAAPQYYSQPAASVQPRVVATTAAVVQAPAAVPCDSPVQAGPPSIGPTPAGQPTGGAPSPSDEPPGTAAAPPAGGKPWYACEGCKDPGCQGGGDCKLYNPPVVTPTNDPHCQGDPKCEERKNPAEGKLRELPGKPIPFYEVCKPFKGTVDVPHLIRNSKEFLKFGRQKYKVDCCEFEVCVVTCCCCVDAKYCALAPFEADLEVCYRPDGKIDVYVLNVPGMPKRWVLFLGAGVADVQKQFPNLPAK